MAHETRLLVLAPLALFALACSSAGESTSGTTTTSGSTTTSKAEDLRYTEVQPAHPVPAVMDAKLLSALSFMQQTASSKPSTPQERLAAETLARIEEGVVRIDTLDDATNEDFYHMCRDFALPACATPLADPSTFEPSAADVETLLQSLDGYMWGDRIYLTVTADTDPEVLASTLVHETNHVLNRSECSYYVDVESQVLDDKKAFLEEYRAFAVEYVFVHPDAPGSPVAVHEYADKTLVDLGYGFDATISDIVGAEPPETVVVSLLAEDGQYGWLVPALDHWPPSFGACTP